MQIMKSQSEKTVLVRIPKPESSVDWNEFVDAFPGWAKRLEFKLPRGPTEITFRARSPFNQHFDICRVIINVIEPSPPVVTFCPESYVVELNQFETSRSLFWKDPTFESKHPLKHILKSQVSGSVFGPGIHPIVYVATDVDGLSAKCSFEITVQGLMTA